MIFELDFVNQQTRTLFSSWEILATENALKSKTNALIEMVELYLEKEGKESKKKYKNLSNQIPEILQKYIYPKASELTSNTSLPGRWNYKELNINYIQGPTTSFTASRVLFIWLKSFAYFHTNIRLGFTKLSPEQSLELETAPNFELLNQLKSSSLYEYTQKPRIGLKEK